VKDIAKAASEDLGGMMDVTVKKKRHITSTAFM
jgi:hypothetical protein